MAKPARLADVAKLAGVSTALVSRIVNADPTLRVRDETRDAVLHAVALLNYTPHPSARALRNAQTGLIGFALHGVNDPLYVEMVNAAQAEAALHNYSVILMNIEELSDRRDAFREIVLAHRVDGLLIHGGHARGEVQLQEIARTLPSVMFNADQVEGLRTIRFDDAEAAAIATRHLIELGHQEIAFLGDIGATSRRRYEGYRDALIAAGLPVRPSIEAGLSPDSSHDATMAFLGSRPGVSAIVAMSTTTALGVHSGIAALELRIPEDIALISVHDVWFARHLNPPLSAVALPLAQMGAVAVQTLLDQIGNPRAGETVLSEPAPQIVVRGSTSARSPLTRAAERSP